MWMAPLLLLIWIRHGFLVVVASSFPHAIDQMDLGTRAVLSGFCPSFCVISSLTMTAGMTKNEKKSL